MRLQKRFLYRSRFKTALFDSGSRKGSILVIAVWVLVFFSILNAALYKTVSSQIEITKRLEKRLVGRAASKAACIHAKKQRHNDETDYDTLWELKEDKVRELGRGGFSYVLVDEESKINLNTATQEILSRLPGWDEKIAEAAVNSPYRPFGSKEEVLLIAGVSAQIYDKCKDFITAYGEGAVNINTAPAETLRALGMDDNLIGIIDGYRAGPDGIMATEDDGIFESASGILNALRDYTSLFAGQQTLLLELINNKQLGVAGKYFTLRADTYFLNQPAGSYDIVMSPDKVLRWTE